MLRRARTGSDGRRALLRRARVAAPSLVAWVLLGCGAARTSQDAGSTEHDGGVPGHPGDAGQDAGWGVGLDAGGSADAAGGSADAAGDAGSTCTNRLPATSEAPATLRQTVLYRDFDQKLVAEDMRYFEPQFELWSDGADKRRWMYLPECAPEPINNIDQSDWRFPVGTWAFKEFSMNGVLIETRLVHRFGPGADDFLFAHYLWNQAQTEATLITEDTDPTLLRNPRGFDYTIPSPRDCGTCHGQTGGEPGGQFSRYLGFSAVQLAHSGPGVTLKALSDEGWLARLETGTYTPPGNARERAALGYLHANCAHCHNESTEAVQFPNHPFSFALKLSETTVWSTGTYRTAVGAEMRGFFGGCSSRVELGATEDSCAYTRMRVRDGSNGQMPPLATQRVHDEGVTLIRAWLE